MNQLKDFKPNLPTNNKIEDIIANPEGWAEEFAQNVLEIEGFRMFKAKKLGTEFAESLLEDKNGLE